MDVSPIAVGMHCYTRMLTSKSHPVVLTVFLGHVRIAAENEVFYNGPADQLEAKYKTLKASIEVRPAGGKPLYIAALGAASSGEHSPAQVEEILRNQERAAQDPQASQLEAGRTVWIGGSNHADGTYGGGLQILAGRELGTLKRVGAMVTEALYAVGVRPL